MTDARGEPGQAVRSPNTRIDDHLVVMEMPDALAATDLFRHRYRAEPPDFPHHVVAFERTPAGPGAALCYVHFTARGELLLGGGACVDNRRLRHLGAEARTAIRAAGGLYRHTLDWSVRHFAPRFGAIFGYCGDALAERVDLAVGFERTPHRHLLAFFTRELDAGTRARLVAEAHAVGPF